MKPAVFDYLKPKTLQEALALLDENSFDSKLLAGGQSLIPMMNMRLARPKILIDLNKIDELNYIRLENENIIIGGLTRHFSVEMSPVIQDACPMLAEGMKLIGHSQIRSRGTIGGSLVHADPTAELPVMLTTLEGMVTVVSSEGERYLASDELFITYMTTSMEENEILTKVSIPIIKPRTGHAIEEFTLRKGDFAIVLAAASVTLDEDGAVEKAILCIGGVDGVPVRLDEITDLIVGHIPNEGTIEEACSGIADLLEPEPDIHASAEYRKDLSVVLSSRVLKKAIERAKISASKEE
ncbi:xanthine dehydrogenase family protein subunit M [Bacillus sp. B15-48]|uniref:FAD binding domain-containing protein n=1 Tax=Bacillus sp. B15-48 TaxID=1548601 RepID=UPI00193F26C2|nr:xanthine dehydrogenase family protein subunit M [Bacillus sp. B15-48]MBM4764875.1 xanthine dehydrogenase family protein subunit M [Bacillus sp. B15-48]